MVSGARQRVASVIVAVGTFALLAGIWCAVANRTVLDRDWFATHGAHLLADNDVLLGPAADRLGLALERSLGGSAADYSAGLVGTLRSGGPATEGLLGAVHDALFSDDRPPEVVFGVDDLALSPAAIPPAVLERLEGARDTEVAFELPELPRLHAVGELSAGGMRLGLATFAATALAGAVIASDRGLLVRRSAIRVMLQVAGVVLVTWFLSVAVPNRSYQALASSVLSVYWVYGLALICVAAAAYLGARVLWRAR